MPGPQGMSLSLNCSHQSHAPKSQSTILCCAFLKDPPSSLTVIQAGAVITWATSALLCRCPLSHHFWHSEGVLVGPTQVPLHVLQHVLSQMLMCWNVDFAARFFACVQTSESRISCPLRAHTQSFQVWPYAYYEDGPQHWFLLKLRSVHSSQIAWVHF